MDPRSWEKISPEMRIPAFIINYNRLTLPKNMAEFICKNENVDVYIIDNNSSYKPLLEWYKTCPYKVIYMEDNYGHTVFWEHKLYDKYVKEGWYILTDSDLDLSEIPDNWLEVLIEGLNRYKYSKVGFSLKTEDLPMSTFKNEIVAWESQFCTPKARRLDDLYTEAHIDTTFALHRTDEHGIYSSVRVNYPYTAKHIPWYYTDFDVLPEDEKYYFNNLKTSTLWSRQFNQNKMKIVKATYGNLDVAEVVKSKIKGGKLLIRACNSIFGDPNSGTVKYLTIEFGDGEIISAKEGSIVAYPKTLNDRLGIFYSNNINPETKQTIVGSLKQLEKVSEGKADIFTCMWRSEPENPFREYIAWTQTFSHLNQLLQIMQLLYTAKEQHDYKYVSFLEHDVMYGEGYFDYPEFDSGTIMTNMNYMGVNEFGFQPLGQRDEPFHQMTMHFNDAIGHCEKILSNALVRNSGLIEPQDMERKQWESKNPSIHVNHGHHFTSHYNVYRKDSYFYDHDYWGSHDNYKKYFKL